MSNYHSANKKQVTAKGTRKGALKQRLIDAKIKAYAKQPTRSIEKATVTNGKPRSAGKMKRDKYGNIIYSM